MPVRPMPAGIFGFQEGFPQARGILCCPCPLWSGVRLRVRKRIAYSAAFVPRDAPIQFLSGTNGLTLVWPAQAGLLSLSSATDLVPPIVWTPVDLFRPSPVDIHPPYCYLDLSATNQTLFFRLQTP